MVAAKKGIRRAERILSLESMVEHRLLAWSVRAVLISRTIIVKKSFAKPSFFAKKLSNEEYLEGRIVVYRAYFLRLLATPKPLRDQLVIELPTLMGFRSGEISTLRHEHIDFEHGDIQVLDSKKRQLFMVPLDPTVAAHLDEYIRRHSIKEGLIFRALQKGGKKPEKDRGLSPTTIQWIWRRWCQACGIPYMPPRYGRAYFAVNWHIFQGKSLIGLMDILRNDNLLSTQAYLSKIRCYEDVKAEFYRGMKWPGFESRCSREACPLRVEGCHCRMFIPMEVKKENV